MAIMRPYVVDKSIGYAIAFLEGEKREGIKRVLNSLSGDIAVLGSPRDLTAKDRVWLSRLIFLSDAPEGVRVDVFDRSLRVVHIRFSGKVTGSPVVNGVLIDFPSARRIYEAGPLQLFDVFPDNPEYHFSALLTISDRHSLITLNGGYSLLGEPRSVSAILNNEMGDLYRTLHLEAESFAGGGMTEGAVYFALEPGWRKDPTTGKTFYDGRIYLLGDGDDVRKISNVIHAAGSPADHLREYSIVLLDSRDPASMKSLAAHIIGIILPGQGGSAGRLVSISLHPSRSSRSDRLPNRCLDRHACGILEIGFVRDKGLEIDLPSIAEVAELIQASPLSKASVAHFSLSLQAFAGKLGGRRVMRGYVCNAHRLSGDLDKLLLSIPAMAGHVPFSDIVLESLLKRN